MEKNVFDFYNNSCAYATLFPVCRLQAILFFSAFHEKMTKHSASIFPHLSTSLAKSDFATWTQYFFRAIMKELLNLRSIRM
jgi:hypothetical protein